MKHEYMARFELNGTLEMRFVHFAVDFRALKFTRLGFTRRPVPRWARATIHAKQTSTSSREDRRNSKTIRHSLLKNGSG